MKPFGHAILRVLTVIGARPQFVKAAAVSRAIAARNASLSTNQPPMGHRGPSPLNHYRLPIAHRRSLLTEVIVHTGQHYDPNMSTVFFEELDIPRPDYHLGIGGLSHGAMTGRMLEKLEEVMIRERPDVVLVYGDTDSTLAGALAAVKLHIPVAHVEAGLRSFNRRMPEEINRVLTDHASDLLFTPTDAATRNLEREGIAGDKVRQVGDVMYDAALFYAEKADQSSDVLDRHGLTRKDYVLATVHRRENTDDRVRLKAILEGLQELAADRPVVLPLHPRTRGRVEEFGLNKRLNGLTVIPPVGYLDMVMLERSAEFIVTDSGGVQKEAYFHGVPCVTLRNETEWVELLEMGWNVLCPPATRSLKETLSALQKRPKCDSRPYGDGTAADRIIEVLLEWR